RRVAGDFCATRGGEEGGADPLLTIRRGRHPGAEPARRHPPYAGRAEDRGGECVESVATAAGGGAVTYSGADRNGRPVKFSRRPPYCAGASAVASSTGVTLTATVFPPATRPAPGRTI